MQSSEVLKGTSITLGVNMKLDNNQKAFFALLQSGLWERDIELAPFKGLDYSVLYKIAKEQSVVGVVVAGLEHVTDVKVPQDILLNYIGNALQIEHKNVAMNNIVGSLVEKMRKAGIYTLLVKGQGVAQCYERPLWRSCGDIDFYLSKDNFLKAKKFFRPLVVKFDPDNEYTQHINMHYEDWVVEIHANQHSTLSSRIDKELDKIHKDLFNSGNVRSWMNGKTQVFLPDADIDVLLSFTHYLNHFYKGGLGVRQICDWSRLLWTYRGKLNLELLDSRLCQMGLVSEWKAFGAFAVEYLGMPSEAMPLYDGSNKWREKAKRIKNFVIEVGNFGHNRDMSYYGKYPFLLRKLCSLGVRIGDLCHHVGIFPMDSLRFSFSIMKNGVANAVRGEG